MFDTSCFINGQRDHFKMTLVPGIWEQVGEAVCDGRIALPRAVFRELVGIDDELSRWIKQYAGCVAEPTEEVQRTAGRFSTEFDTRGGRNTADPWVLAEAEVRKFTVSTYEGRSFNGQQTTRWSSKMPGICQRFKIPCCTLPEALERLEIRL